MSAPGGGGGASRGCERYIPLPPPGVCSDRERGLGLRAPRVAPSEEAPAGQGTWAQSTRCAQHLTRPHSPKPPHLQCTNTNTWCVPRCPLLRARCVPTRSPWVPVPSRPAVLLIPWTCCPLTRHSASQSARHPSQTCSTHAALCATRGRPASHTAARGSAQRPPRAQARTVARTAASCLPGSTLGHSWPRPLLTHPRPSHAAGQAGGHTYLKVQVALASEACAQVPPRSERPLQSRTLRRGWLASHYSILHSATPHAHPHPRSPGRPATAPLPHPHAPTTKSWEIQTACDGRQARWDESTPRPAHRCSLCLANSESPRPGLL